MEYIALYLVDGMLSGSVGLADLGHADGDAQAAEERIGSVTVTATVIEKLCHLSILSLAYPVVRTCVTVYFDIPLPAFPPFFLYFSIFKSQVK